MSSLKKSRCIENKVDLKTVGSCRKVPLDTCKDKIGGKCTLEGVVDSYIERNAKFREEELAFYKNQESLSDAISLAAMAKMKDGRKHPHQWRIKLDVLREARERLLTKESKIGNCKTFDALHKAIEEIIGDIKGVGPLVVYDTALRIGERLALEPENLVYLHAGALAGARKIGVKKKRGIARKEDFPSPLQKLTAGQIEDCLCIYKDYLDKYDG